MRLLLDNARLNEPALNRKKERYVMRVGFNVMVVGLHDSSRAVHDKRWAVYDTSWVACDTGRG